MIQMPQLPTNKACLTDWSKVARFGLARILMIMFLFGIPIVHVYTQELLEQPRPVHRAVYTIVYDPADLDAGAITRALETLVFPAVQALWFTGDPVSVRASAQVTIQVERSQPSAFSVLLEVISLDDQRILGTYNRIVRLDPAGRYSLAVLWQPLIEKLQEALDSKDPRISLGITGPVGASIRVLNREEGSTSQGGDVLVEGTLPSGGTTEILLTRFQYLEVELSLSGHRSARNVFFLEDAPQEMIVELYRYPIHTLGFFLQELSFPELDYTYYTPQGRWTASLGVTSYLGGITPLRELNDVHQSAQLISSIPLTRISATAGVLLRDQDHPLRIHLQGGFFLRLIHTEELSGLEPVLPSGAVMRIGAEFEVSPRLIVSAALGSDVYWPVTEPFVGSQILLRRVGPAVLQTGLLRLGVRVKM